MYRRSDDGSFNRWDVQSVVTVGSFALTNLPPLPLGVGSFDLALGALPLNILLAALSSSLSVFLIYAPF